jgi:hypothetical protein
MGTSTIETWVGRDLARYLPGFYWLTGVSADLAQRCGVGAEVLHKIDGAAVSSDTSGSLTVRMPGSPRQWTTWKEKVDSFCLAHPGVFSLDRILPKLVAAKTYRELSYVLREWP